MSTDLIVRFAGEGGQGQVTAADGLAEAAARVGYHVQTYATYPSQIKGGPTWAQTRISTQPILNDGDQLDVLVVLNHDAYEQHIGELRDGGVLVYNAEDFELDTNGNMIGLQVEALARSTGNPRAANMVVIGAVAALGGMPAEYFEDFITVRFTRGRDNDEQIIKANIEALKLGVAEVEKTGFRVADLDAPPPDEGERVVIKGNDALSLGALSAGLDVFIGYPISPATTILVFMEGNLHGEGKAVVQASSEIESISAIIGAGYAGKKAMTSTAGPGLSLMGEGLGFAWMAEIPCVVVDVQRGGPATGLPTKTEQSDLLACLNPGHGDLRLPVIAPGTVEECFKAGMMALNWAERYQGPVILLSEMQLAERAQDILRPDPTLIAVENRTVSDGADGNRRYKGQTITPFPVPGGPGAYVANASEHDEQGDTVHQPHTHLPMTQRRFGKLQLLEEDDFEAEHGESRVAIMPWGGSKGTARSAFEELRKQGDDVAWYYTMYINPLPPALLAELRTKELVLVPELNYLGQFSGWLRQQGVNAESITQITGLPFKVSDLVRQVRERTAPERLATV
ncbi:MAG: 2-oxoacid:acceptor oxidoreductase subunit alpha [Chloroflexi bacterium]|nr:2-oxoacid:acceptor oxidoreductase subunit alpha [Chloroflexota bacterium]